MTDLRTVLRATLEEADPDRHWTDDQVRDLGLAFQSHLHTAGFEIHDVRRCVRPPLPEDIGRPWSEVMAGRSWDPPA